MGILDDAIRQHLELKRQHGAPEEELQRQEEEALGPARRDVAPAEPPGGDGDVEFEGEASEAASEEETALFEPAPEELETMLEEPGLEREPSDEPEQEPEAARDEPEPDRDEADVLEDTPDFLQETPEHDRLWFEQKPPRDFDFD